MKWRKPELICFKTKDLLCKVKAKAFSVNSCYSDYNENNGGEGGDRPTAIGSSSLTYDEIGNPPTIGSNTYTWKNGR